ncbi:DUF3854 domain-containing protein [Leptolyngbya sp. PL-A3]|uniref:plasmid replication protein, CyRepA1 family n=1 Tax=Leptolyngbya sp. PL-A3 TaxID=2933911 RepID=UPI0032994CD5
MSVTTSRPQYINLKHWEEWTVGSGVHPSIVAASIATLSGDRALQALLYEAIPNSDHAKTYVTVGTSRLLERYEFATKGGWFVTGVDPLNNWQPMQWGQFKPDHPRIDPESWKPLKYEAPPKAEPRALFLPVNLLSSCEIAINYAAQEAQEAWIQRFRTYLGRLQENRPAEALQAACERRELREIGRLLREALCDQARNLETEHGHFHSGGIQGLTSTIDEGFWPWVHSYNVPVIITEGAKKAAKLLSEGYLAIALPGITMGVRTRQDGVPCLPHLIPDLQFFATPERRVYICFDYETKPKTIQNVARETEKLKQQLSKAGCKVKIVSLPGPQKGVDDFIVAQGTDAFHQAFNEALSFELWQSRRYSQLTYQPDLLLNRRYLGELPIPTDAKLVLLKSPKGTGKTQSFLPIVEEATASGQRVLLITHRIQLGQAICDRVGLPYVTELRTSEEGRLMGYGVCVDSLFQESAARFNADHWHNTIVIIDECEQVIWHLLSSTTEISSRRIPVMAQIKQLLLNTLESDRGKIILSDADLSDLSLEFIWGLIEQRVKPWTVINTYRPETPWQVHHYAHNQPDQLVAALDEDIANGGKPFVFTQSQKSKGRWSTTTLEGWIKKRHPDKRVLRIDSQTVADPSHEAFGCTSKINEVIKNYDVVIVSPVIETGLSIDIKGHFTGVWAILNGVAPENSARQALARVREGVPRHVWIKKYGLGKVANGSTSSRAILSAEYEISKVASKILQILTIDEEMVAAYASSLKLWARMAARINASTVSYREAVIYGLQTEGHHIIEANHAEGVFDAVHEIETTRDEQHQAECEAIATAEDVTLKEYEELKGKKSKTKADQYKERKHSIQDRYCTEVTPELVSKDDDGWYPKLRLLYFLQIGRQFLSERDRQALDNVAKTGGVWLPTMNRSQYSVKVGMLEALGVKKLLDPEKAFNGGIKRDGYEDAHPYLLELRAQALKFASRIKNALGVSISDKMSPIQIAQSLLSKVGIKLKCVGQSGGAGHRERIYQFVEPKDGRDEILHRWFTRDDASRTNSEMHTPGINNQLPHQVGGAA